MPRRIKPKETKRDWRWWTSMLLNGAVVLSMVLGTIFVFAGVPTRSAVPTLEVPTAAPTTVAPPTIAPPTSAPSATPTPTASAYFQFAVAGDSRDGDVVYSKVLERVAREGNAFLIHTGDLVSNGTKEEWLNFRSLMKDFNLPFYPVPGNHEIRSGRISNYLQYSGVPTTHYSFDRGAVHFTFVDSSAGSLLDSEFAYLDGDLAASQAPVKMVFVHHPPFDPAGSTHVMTMGRDKFMQIVKQRDAKYVFAGHIHCYEEAERDGVKYIITGGAGAPLYCAPTAGGFYHYVRVKVSGEKIMTEVVKIG
jgi:serine/threonine-protein phosphatase CPPED1